VRRIVVLRALGLGDMVTAVPALHALRAAHPEAELMVAAPQPLASIVELAGGTLVDAEPLQPLPPPAHGADLLVNLHGRGPQSHAVALAARPRRLIAFAHDEVPESAGMPVWRAGEHEVARWCRLLRQSGISTDPGRLDLPAPPLPAHFERARGATVVHPGAGSGARRWPAARFAAVAAAEAADHRPVVITGGPDERPLAARVARAAGLPARAVLAGTTDVRTLAAVVAHAARVVCGDTGVAHLATAFGVPSVVLFGPTSPAVWGPPPARAARHRVLWAGRTGDPFAERPHDGLLEIAPRQVLDELAQLPS
jgi:ADP-heptose:LPS heptosyltransferase